MNEGKSPMTYGAFMGTNYGVEAIHGVPGIAVRLGRALEKWGLHRWMDGVSQPIDREALRRDRERQLANEARMMQVERLYREHR